MEFKCWSIQRNSIKFGLYGGKHGRKDVLFFSTCSSICSLICKALYTNVLLNTMSDSVDIESGQVSAQPRYTLRRRISVAITSILSCTWNIFRCRPCISVVQFIDNQEDNHCCYSLLRYMLHCLIVYGIGVLVGVTLHLIFGPTHVSAAISSVIHD